MADNTRITTNAPIDRNAIVNHITSQEGGQELSEEDLAGMVDIIASNPVLYSQVLRTEVKSAVQVLQEHRQKNEMSDTTDHWKKVKERLDEACRGSNSSICRSKTQKELKVFKAKQFLGHSVPITAISLVDGFVATGSSDTTVRLWDVDTGHEVRRYSGHRDTVTSVMILNKSNSSSFAFLLAMLNQTTSDQSRIDGARNIDIRNIDFESMNSVYVIISASVDCYFRVWRSDSSECLMAVYTMNPLLCLSYLCNMTDSRHQIITGSDGGKLEVRNYPSYENTLSLLSVQTGTSAIKKLEVYCKRILCIAADGTVCLYDIKLDRLNQIFKSSARNESESIYRAIAIYSHTVYCGHDGPDIAVINIADGVTRTLKNHTSSCGRTNDIVICEKFLISTGYDDDIEMGYFNVRRLPDEEYLGTVCDMNTGRITCLSVAMNSSGGLICATGGEQLKIWIQADPQELNDTKKTRNPKKNGNEEHDSDDDDDENGDDDDDESASNSVNKTRTTEVIHISGFRRQSPEAEKPADNQNEESSGERSALKPTSRNQNDSDENSFADHNKCNVQ